MRETERLRGLRNNCLNGDEALDVLDRLSAGTTSSTTTVVVIAMGWPPVAVRAAARRLLLQCPDLWVPKTYATWADALENAGGSVKCSASAGPVLALPVLAPPVLALPVLALSVLARPEVDDLRLVGLKLIFLVVSRVMSLLRLSPRESSWKDAQILRLRHTLAIAERDRPKARARLTWPDRAWLALLAGTVLGGMRLLVTPGTIFTGIATSSAAGGDAFRGVAGSGGWRRTGGWGW